MQNPVPVPARRTLLKYALAGSALWAAPLAWCQDPGDGGRLVVVFLRGAYDGLSALVPYADRNYQSLRPNIALPAPDGSAQTTLALDDTFGLHPAFAALLPLWKQGVLAAIPAAGSPDPTRSHFDAQHYWETGIPGNGSSATGWMNTLAGLRGSQPAAPPIALGVGEANPLILAGHAAVTLVPRGQAATRQGALGDARTHDALMALYAGQDPLSQAFRSGAQSRMQTAQTLSKDMDDSEKTREEMLAANNGARSVQGLVLDAQHLGTLMRQDRRLRLGFLSAGGWDTHANQGAVTGALANNLATLAGALVQLRRDFQDRNDVVLVCSEFGRTSAENGTRGTDHGHGNAIWIMGNRVQGGRWHGTWTGLAPTNLHEGRDLPVHHDYRAVLAQVIRNTQGLDVSAIEQLFPGFGWDKNLDGLMHA